MSNNDNNNTASAAKNKDMQIGAFLFVAGLALGFFTYAHRPPEGFMDALQRADSWAFKREVYYILLFVSALFGVAGLLRIAKGLKK